MKKIDFVLPWVDSSDPKWQLQRQDHQGTRDYKDANAQARFRDMETLKYVLRSIEKHCPWYNRIYLITEGHLPDWLNADHEKITLVTHEELFIERLHLPVFNSSAIEMNLVNLSNLSEYFVYLNDDMLIMQPIEEERFFREKKPVDFFSHSFIPRNRLFELLKSRDSWIHSLNNNLAHINFRFQPIRLSKEQLYHHSYSFSTKINNVLFDTLFKRFIWIEHWHHPQPYLKQTLKDVYETFGDAMMQCSQNRFRNKGDLTQYIYRYWQLASGNFVPYKHNDALISNLDSIEVLDNLISEIAQNPKINFVCFNDSTKLDDKAYERVKQELIAYLEQKFPQKASFEK